MNSRVQIGSVGAFGAGGLRPRRLLQDHDTLMAQVQLGVSVVLSVLTLLALAYWRDGEVASQYRSLALITALLMLGIYKWRGVYRRFNGRYEGCLRIGRSWLLLVALVFATAFITRTGEDYSRLVILGWALVGYLTQVSVYQFFYYCSHRQKAEAMPLRKALVVGANPLAAHLVESVNRNAWLHDRVVGMLDDGDGGQPELSSVLMSVPRLGGVDELAGIVAARGISRVYIAVPLSHSQRIEQIYNILSGTTIDVVWVPDIFSLRPLNHSVKEINGLPLITLSESPLASETQALCKEVLDKSVALLMLIALGPLMLMIAFLVWQSSPGPIIFRQKRHGWDGRIIEVWKFRSMKVHVDRRVSQAKRNDNRITRIGRFIRRTSIDELPQLFNVLQGRMSLVGPRPHALEHNEFYSTQIPAYMLRHRIKPGLTGLAQVNGYRGETETLDKMLRRVDFDIQYINSWSIWLDLVILAKTPMSLLAKDIY